MKRTRLRKRSKKDTILKRLQNKAENLWKQVCKDRDKVCQICGSKEVLQVHHIFSRKNKGLFLDVENGILLCRNCHCKVSFGDDGLKEKIRRIKIKKDPATYDRLYEQDLDKSPFLEWKNINYLEEQIKILQSIQEEK
jgi:5-methylcytosine-specific restriction endonuclease McrA